VELSSRGRDVLQSVIAGYDTCLTDAVHLFVHSFMEVRAVPRTAVHVSIIRANGKEIEKRGRFFWGKNKGNRHSDLSSRIHPGAGVRGAEPLRGEGFQPVALPGPCSIRLRDPRLSKARAHESLAEDCLTAVRESHVLSEWLRRRLQAAAAQPIQQIPTLRMKGSRHSFMFVTTFKAVLPRFRVQYSAHSRALGIRGRCST